MKKLAIFMMLALPMLAWGQNSWDAELILDTEDGYGYYITLEGKVVSGLKFYKLQQDKLEIPAQNSHPGKAFLPGEIREYGLERGLRFCSAEIQIGGVTKKVFLEVIVETPAYTVMYHPEGKKKHFFVYQDGITRSISEDGVELRSLMRQQVAGCKHLEQLDKVPMKMTPWGIRDMQDAYTNCNPKPMHRPVRFGVSVSMSLDRVTRDTGADRTKSQFGYMASLFVDIPLDPRISLIPEFGFKRAKLAYDDTEYSLTYHKIGVENYERTSLFIPLMFRYTANNLRGKIVPYVEAGPMMEFRLSKNNLPSNIDPGDDIELENALKLLRQSKNMFGVTVGAGMEWRITRRNALLVSLRYNWARGKDAFDRPESYKIFALNVGVTF